MPKGEDRDDRIGAVFPEVAVPMTAFEGVVENGRIRLRENVALPEGARVYIVVADQQDSPSAHVRTPRLAHPRQASDFHKTIIEVPGNE